MQAVRVAGNRNGFAQRAHLRAADAALDAFLFLGIRRIVLFRRIDFRRLRIRWRAVRPVVIPGRKMRSEEHTSELQLLMRISYAVFCLKKKHTNTQISRTTQVKSNSKT